ncbi:peptidase G1, partial [Mycena galericulata]
SIWAAIDGYACNTATLKTGLDIEFHNGLVSYFSWREYNPGGYSIASQEAPPQGISFSAGDEITLTVQVDAGVDLLGTEIFNAADGATSAGPFQFPSPPEPVLCQSDAIWAVETWQTGDNRAPFSVQFKDVSATRGDGLVVGPGNATVINTVENGAAL